MDKPSPASSLTPAELKMQLKLGEPVYLLDVREADEWQRGHIEGAHWIPMREIPTRLAELPRDRPIVAYCHHGTRSANVQQYLLQHGFTIVHNLRGGIHAWSEEVDPSVPTY